MMYKEVIFDLISTESIVLLSNFISAIFIFSVSAPTGLYAESHFCHSNKNYPVGICIQTNTQRSESGHNA